MRLVEHETNRAICLGEIASGAKQRLYGSNLIRAVVERYGFIEGPKTTAEFNLQTGIVFRQGYFRDEVIDRFQVYNNGMFAEGKVDTDLSEAFLADVIDWARTEAGLSFNEGTLGRIYMSELVIQSDSIEMSQALSVLKTIQDRISSFVSQSTAHNLPAQVSGFLIQSDPGAGAGWLYRFERRAGLPFSAQLFFSSAPLKTKDHLKLLEQLEQALT